MNTINIVGHYNQSDLKRIIREQFTTRPELDGEIQLIISGNDSLQSLFTVINIRGFFEKVTRLELRSIPQLRNINALEKFVNLKEFVFNDCGSRQEFDFPNKS